MNQIRQIQALNKRELENGISPEASWHTDYRDTAFVYFGGLPFEVSEGDVITIFSQFGEPTFLKLARDKETGKSKGFGWLKYEDQRSTDLAVDNLGGATIGGRMVKVDHARYKARDDDDPDEGKIGWEDMQRVERAANGTAEDTEEESDEEEEAQRPMLQEERELAKLMRDHDDDDPMKAFLIEEKKKEVEEALRKEERHKKKHKHRHHHRSHRSRKDEGEKQDRKRIQDREESRDEERSRARRDDTPVMGDRDGADRGSGRHRHRREESRDRDRDRDRRRDDERGGKDSHRTMDDSRRERHKGEDRRRRKHEREDSESDGERGHRSRRRSRSRSPRR